MNAHRPSAYRFAIVGAGLAGLSLARALARSRIPGSVAIVDAKETFPDDRTWSFWDTDNSTDAALATGSWSHWQLTDASGTYVQHSSTIPYVTIKSREFYDSTLAEIGAADYDLVLGEAVTSIEERADGCTVTTPSQTIAADYVFDARGLTPAMLAGVDVVQRFVGYRIETASDAFDPTVATLMDVQADTEDGFHFFYVLPFGPREALVENTYFARRPIRRERLEAELDRYVARRFGAERPAIRYREAGALPMSSSFKLPRSTQRVIPIGLRGGCARPGTGYTFHRVQAQVARIARAFAVPQATLDLDDIAASAPGCDAFLLAAASRAPDLLPRAFRRLFATIDGDRLARFMMDRASTAETFPVLLASALGAGEALAHRAALPQVGKPRLAPR